MDASLTVVPTELSYNDFVDRGHAMHGWAALRVNEGLPENLHLMTIEELVDKEWEERNIGLITNPFFLAYFLDESLR